MERVERKNENTVEKAESGVANGSGDASDLGEEKFDKAGKITMAAALVVGFEQHVLEGDHDTTKRVTDLREECENSERGSEIGRNGVTERRDE